MRYYTSGADFSALVRVKTIALAGTTLKTHPFMKLSEFIMLEETEKNKAVLHHGVLLGKQKEEAQIYFLFQMDQFYVELLCDHLSRKVCRYQAFTDTRFLQPYLDQIQLNGLLD